MDTLLYFAARALIGLVQALPLIWVARLGRACGAVAYYLDGRHRRVAIKNLTMCFGESLDPQQIHDLAKENFRRIGENFGCAAKTAAMSWSELQAHIEFAAPKIEHLSESETGPRRVVAAIGHFGNFELYARFGQMARHYSCATTYRGLRQHSLDRLLQGLRRQSGCEFFERRFEGNALKTFMHREHVILGLLADQHAGDHGLRLPFLGHECSTSPAPAVFALRYNCYLTTGICYRIGLGRWRVEEGEPIATHEDGQPRSTAAIMLDVNRAFETAVKRDPANWFWVHNRWKAKKFRPTRTAQTSAVATLPGTSSEASERA